jgi:hypothetical protein
MPYAEKKLCKRIHKKGFLKETGREILAMLNSGEKYQSSVGRGGWL